MMTFETIKATLPDKWLDYYQINRCWIKPLMDLRNGWRKTPDQGKRPCADIILGAITALEPGLSFWMPPFCELSSEGNKLIEVLGLNFDPERELKKRKEERAKDPQLDSSNTDEIELTKRAEERAKNPELNSSDTDEIERIRQQLQTGEL